MQTTSSRIWTLVAGSIFYDNNFYALSASKGGIVSKLSKVSSFIFLYIYEKK